MGWIVELYNGLKRIDERQAFSIAREHILDEQENLREINPKNILLKLVSTKDGKSIVFDHRLRPIISEHTPCHEYADHYTIVGYYIKLLKEEQKFPKFHQPKVM